MNRRSLRLIESLAGSLILGGVAVAGVACRRDSPTGSTDTGTREAVQHAAAVTGTRSAAPTAAKRGRMDGGGTDVTFLVVSDLHFGFGNIERQHEALVPKLNDIAGRPYPPSIGGVVARPRGLLVTGDLTEWGTVEEWQPFVAIYGRNGIDGKLSMPVFEVIGNHDKVHGPWVEQQVAIRHGGARFYAWDWGDIHLVALGEAPDDEGLAFLERDLLTLEHDVPLVLFFHLPLDGPWSNGNWFGDGDFRSRLARLLEGRSVAAIFHGHHHATAHYTWHGIDVFKPGAVKDGAHTFATVRITDDRFTLASYDWDRQAWTAAFTKSIAR
jgi:3',5'-cyclic AMP phosphodiesterase CpdA